MPDPLKPCGVLSRRPYYPELAAACGGLDTAGTLVISQIVYLSASAHCVAFNLCTLSRALAKTLRLPQDSVAKTLTKLQDSGILKGPAAAARLDQDALSASLLTSRLRLPVRLLQLAADDSRDLMCRFEERDLPVCQGLTCAPAGKAFMTGALRVAMLLTALGAKSEKESFMQAALAPGWRLLTQPPATADDLAGRWSSEVRIIDVQLAEGLVFVPEGSHEPCLCRQHGRRPEPLELAAMIFVCLSAPQEPGFISDAPPALVAKACAAVADLTGYQAVIGAPYLRRLDPELRDEARSVLASWLAGDSCKSEL